VNKIFITFTQNIELYDTVDKIKNNYSVVNNKILVLQTEDQKFACVYILEPGMNHVLNDSICVHRKKLTNTYYTINGLNCLIISLNGGVLDTSYPINWENYKNCIIVSNNNNLRKINTVFYKTMTL
jgi:hypothetical protein